MTTTVVELVEWGAGESVHLTAGEANALRRLEGALRITWKGEREARVAPREGTVGIASLSPATTLMVRPRWPVASLLELAAYAYGLTMPPIRETAMIEEGGPQDWMALLLATEVERLLAQGLRQGYREVEEEIPYVRGRIDFNQMRPSRERPGLIPCRFSDFVLDTVENRVLRGTLEILSTTPLCTAVRRRVCSALAAFLQVPLITPTRAMLSSSRLDRLNAYYRPSLEFCRLVIEAIGIELSPGAAVGASFFFPMPKLFESALERALSEAFPGPCQGQRTYADRILVRRGGPPWSVALRPDNVLGRREAPWLVVDAKYKRPTVEHWEAERYLSTDLYQAFTYAVALRAPVILVYPEVEEPIDATLALADHTVKVRTVDIGRHGVGALRGLAGELVAQHCGLDAPGVPRKDSDVLTCEGGAVAPRELTRQDDVGPMLSRAEGCLLGQLAGDALGSLVEFESPEAIRAAYPGGVRDLADGGTWNTLAGQPTDDSEMALALARMLVRWGTYSSEHARAAYVAWLESRPFDLGNTVISGLRGRPNPESQANGALMRISPLGIFGARHDLEQVASWAREDAAITHRHPVCQEINALFSMAIAHAVRTGCSAEELYRRIVTWADAMEVEESVRIAVSEAAETPPADYVRQQGWVLIAFQNALWQLLHASSFEEAMVDTVMRGGDTDTNACIAGALLGAVCGREAVPDRWVQPILNCRPEPGRPGVHQPRPCAYWPVDALSLASRLIDLP